MKAQTLRKCGLALLLASIPLFGGCDQEQAHSATINSQAADVNAGGPPANVVPADQNGPAPSVPDQATSDQDLSAAPGTVISTPGSTTAANTNNNPQLNDFVKLVQAGVSETVLLAYATNAPGTFNLSSDDIVYLNDLGAPDSVISAMLQHDQQLTGNTAATTPQPQTGETSQLQTPETTPPTVQTAPEPDTAAYTEATTAEAAAAEPPLTPPDDMEDQVDQSPSTAYSYFYDSLSPYGNWINIQGYGPCWQPTAVAISPGWQPYCDHGHWAYTDCGWCWVSDYSWGWAPFHYGRWFHNSRWGWCWAPDTVWGPAWVSWRYNNSYCGWAPLPPSAYYRPGFGFTYFGQAVGFNFAFGLGVNNFVFVPLSHFHDRAPALYRTPRREITRIYNSTTLNNQIIRGNNHNLINRGVPVDRVSAASHTDIQPVRINAQATGPGGPQVSRDDHSLSVYRPALPAPGSGAAPRRVGEGIQANPNFNLRARVEQPSLPARPVTAPAPERRPGFSTPTTAGIPQTPAGNNRFSQPTEKPGSVIMRGPNANNPATVGNTVRTTPSQPFTPAQNNWRTIPPRETPQATQPSQPLTPSYGGQNVQAQRNEAEQQIQEQRQQILQQQRQLQQQQIQERQQLQQRQQPFQPQQPIQQQPRQEVQPRSFGNAQNQNFNSGYREVQPARPEIAAPPRIMESRPAPEMRSTPQYSAPAPAAPRVESSGGGGGGERGGGGGGGNNNGNNGGGGGVGRGR